MLTRLAPGSTRKRSSGASYPLADDVITLMRTCAHVIAKDEHQVNDIPRAPVVRKQTERLVAPCRATCAPSPTRGGRCQTFRILRFDPNIHAFEHPRAQGESKKTKSAGPSIDAAVCIIRVRVSYVFSERERHRRPHEDCRQGKEHLM
eukprot:1185888-Prorocentrum_minimum.AAC.1